MRTLTEHGDPQPVRVVVSPQVTSPKARRHKLKRDRVDLATACEQFAKATDDKGRNAARDAIERVTATAAGYRIEAPTPSERNEFAKIVAELSADRGSVGLHGVESAAKFAARKLGIAEPNIAPEILKRLDKLL